MKDFLDALIDRMTRIVSGPPLEPEHEPAWLVLRARRQPAAPAPQRTRAGCSRSWI